MKLSKEVRNEIKELNDYKRKKSLSNCEHLAVTKRIMQLKGLI